MSCVNGNFCALSIDVLVRTGCWSDVVALLDSWFFVLLVILLFPISAVWFVYYQVESVEIVNELHVLRLINLWQETGHLKMMIFHVSATFLVRLTFNSAILLEKLFESSIVERILLLSWISLLRWMHGSSCVFLVLVYGMGDLLKTLASHCLWYG